jgi:hypothetical protein
MEIKYFGKKTWGDLRKGFFWNELGIGDFFLQRHLRAGVGVFV